MENAFDYITVQYGSTGFTMEAIEQDNGQILCQDEVMVTSSCHHHDMTMGVAMPLF